MALEWIMYTKFGALGMSHILDDFLFVGPPDQLNCRDDLTNFLFLCARLNVPIKLEKQSLLLPASQSMV